MRALRMTCGAGSAAFCLWKRHRKLSHRVWSCSGLNISTTAMHPHETLFAIQTTCTTQCRTTCDHAGAAGSSRSSVVAAWQQRARASARQRRCDRLRNYEG